MREERREKRERGWITLRRAVMRCCCPVLWIIIYIYINAVRRLIFHIIFASCSCFKHFIYVYRYIYIYKNIYK